MDKNNNLETKIIKILNILKIASLAGIIFLFILQQTANIENAQWTKTALIIVAGIGFSAMISGSLIKKEGNPLKMFIIFLVIIIAFFILVFLLSTRETTSYGYLSMDKDSLSLLYILLGILSVVLIGVYLIKIFLLNKGKKEEVKIINNFTEDEENKSS